VRVEQEPGHELQRRRVGLQEAPHDLGLGSREPHHRRVVTAAREARERPGKVPTTTLRVGLRSPGRGLAPLEHVEEAQHEPALRALGVEVHDLLDQVAHLLGQQRPVLLRRGGDGGVDQRVVEQREAAHDGGGRSGLGGGVGGCARRGTRPGLGPRGGEPRPQAQARRLEAVEQDAHVTGRLVGEGGEAARQRVGGERRAAQRRGHVAPLVRQPAGVEEARHQRKARPVVQRDQELPRGADVQRARLRQVGDALLGAELLHGTCAHVEVRGQRLDHEVGLGRQRSLADRVRLGSPPTLLRGQLGPDAAPVHLACGGGTGGGGGR
jgi:hypothetical protein